MKASQLYALAALAYLAPHLHVAVGIAFGVLMGVLAWLLASRGQ